MRPEHGPHVRESRRRARSGAPPLLCGCPAARVAAAALRGQLRALARRGPKKIELLDQRVTDIVHGGPPRRSCTAGSKGRIARTWSTYRPHAPRPARPPGPDRRRHVVDNRDLRRAPAHPLCDRMRKIGTIDDYQDIRRALNHGVDGLPHPGHQARQVRDHGGETDYRSLRDRKEGLKSVLGHAGSAYAVELNAIAQPLAQRSHQRSSQLVA